MSFFRVSELASKQLVEGLNCRAVYLDKLMMTFFDFAPRAVVPQHKHPHQQITFILEGEMEFTLDGETRVLRKGEGVTIPPNVEHDARVLDTPTMALDAWHPPREDYK